MSSGRIPDLARRIAAVESGRTGMRQAALRRAEHLRGVALAAVDSFVEVARATGASHLDLIRVSDVEPDDKSIRAFQVRITRGRTQAVIVVKDRGEVMLVGPFRRGGAEGPCRPRHDEADDPDPSRLDEAVHDLVADLIEQAFEK